MSKSIKKQVLNECQNSRSFRFAISQKSHIWFFQLYLTHYLNYPFAWFHKQMFEISEDPSVNFAAIIAFRGAGKSTILNLSFALWAVLGQPQRKFVIIASKSMAQAKAHLKNIKHELENNDLLINDFGQLLNKKTNRNSSIIEIDKFEAIIMATSTAKSLRGLRHGTNRPDLIICDDLEDNESEKNERERNSIYQWFVNEIMSSRSVNTKIIVLGGLFHIESLIMRLKEDIDTNKIDGTFRAYPILDDNNKILWPEKFRTQQDIKQLKISIADETVWHNEYLLIPTRFRMTHLIDALKNHKTVPADHENNKKITKRVFDNNGYKIGAPTIIDYNFLFKGYNSQPTQKTKPIINDNEEIRDLIKKYKIPNNP